MVRNKYILEKMNLKYTSLNYEALCRNPKEEITDLFSFLKMDSKSFSLDFRERTQHIMGNYNMRLGKDTEIVERKDWQKALSKADITKIEDLTSDYRQYYTEGS